MERRALSHAALNPNLALMRDDHLASNGQPQAHSSRHAAGNLKILLKYLLMILRRNPGATVTDGKTNSVGSSFIAGALRGFDDWLDLNHWRVVRPDIKTG